MVASNRLVAFWSFSVCLMICMVVNSQVPENWKSKGRVQSSQSVQFMVAVKYRKEGVESATAALFDVSNPSSVNYGKHWSQQEIWSTLGPDSNHVQLVKSWLTSSGLVVMEEAEKGAFIVVRTTAEVAEALLKVELHEFERKTDGQRLIRSTSMYQLPTDIHPLVDVVSGIHDFPSLRRKQMAPKVDLTPVKSSGIEPVPQLMFSSTTQLFAQLIPICQDSKPSSNLTELCSGQGAQLNWFGFQLISGPDDHHVASYNISVSPRTVTCSLQGTTPTCTILVEPVASFKLTTVGVSSGFSDGSWSPQAKWAFKITPNSFVTPQLLRQHYSIPQSAGLQVHPRVSQAVVEFDNQFYSPSDMQAFTKLMGLPPANISLVGFNNPNNPGGEASLDIEYIVAMAPQVPTTFWSNNASAWILDWAMQVNNATNPPLVHSISYLEADQDMTRLYPAGYVQRADQELIKMGLRGLTVIACSGDAGVSNKNHGNHDCTPFHPNFPASSPYVTGVSATMLTTLTSEVCLSPIFGGLSQVECTQLGEMAMSGNLGFFWTTGGGFSTIAPRQEWQKQEVQKWFDQTPSRELPPNGVWNANGRGIPDVSAVGHNLMVVWNGVLTPIDGTSAATPIFAGIVSLINNERLKQGKSPLGYLNPALYSAFANNPSTFNDVVFGSNHCGSYTPSNNPIVEDYCCPYGFNATVGWDPVTGLGTPNFPQLAKALQ